MQIQAMGDAARHEMAAGVYLPPTKFAPCSAPYQTPAHTGFVRDCTDAPGFKQTGTSHVNLRAQHAEEKSTYHFCQSYMLDMRYIFGGHAEQIAHVLVDSITCCNSILPCCLLAVLRNVWGCHIRRLLS